MHLCFAIGENSDKVPSVLWESSAIGMSRKIIIVSHIKRKLRCQVVLENY